MAEFRKLTHNSFEGMVHPEDIKRVEREIVQQVKQSDKKMDFIRYRIVTKTGKVRWVDDCGHLDSDSQVDSQLFYVFLSDITETVSEEEKERLLRLNEYYRD